MNRAFFGLLFGSERFEPWTGELLIAAQADHFAKAAEEEEMSELERSLKRRQLRREVACAVNLRERTARYAGALRNGDVECWRSTGVIRMASRPQRETECMCHQAQMREEARELASSQFGPELLQALGELGAQS